LNRTQRLDTVAGQAMGAFDDGVFVRRWKLGGRIVVLHGIVRILQRQAEDDRDKATHSQRQVRENTFGAKVTSLGGCKVKLETLLIKSVYRAENPLGKVGVEKLRRLGM
jgi:hypothetical protein